MSQQPNILITGAASGIGLATARLFVSRGWFVGLMDLNRQALDSLATELGPGTMILEADITDEEAVTTGLATFCEATGGHLDVLFNCAGLIAIGRFAALPLDRQKSVVRVNFGGLVTCTWLALPWLKRSNRGCIISMSSASAVYGTPRLAVYSASKHAVRGFTEALNMELAADGIHVTDIMVPYVDTPLIREEGKIPHPVRRVGVHITPEQVAETVYRATQGRRVHWHIGRQMRLINTLHWLFPALRRRIFQSIAGM